MFVPPRTGASSVAGSIRPPLQGHDQEEDVVLQQAVVARAPVKLANAPVFRRARAAGAVRRLWLARMEGGAIAVPQ